MPPTRRQRTLSQDVSIHGVGFFTGSEVRMTLRPAEPNTGVLFVRTDLAESIPATIDSLDPLPRRTQLTNGTASVQMVEHTLAALAGLRIDNCRVEIDGPECPGLDGSSAPLADLIDAAGVVTQEAARACLVIEHPLELTDGGGGSIRALPSPSGVRRQDGAGCEIAYTVDYPHPAVGRSRYETTVTPASFLNSIAPARTFVLEREVAALRAAGIGRRHTEADLVVFADDPQRREPLGGPLRFGNEPARHKLLDCVGDFALAGCDLVGRFVCEKSGHALNHALVRELLSTYQIQGAEESTPIPLAAPMRRAA